MTIARYDTIRRINYDTVNAIGLSQGMFRTTKAFKLYARELYGLSELKVLIRMRPKSQRIGPLVMILACYCN